jgi:hypothetical protein
MGFPEDIEMDLVEQVDLVDVNFLLLKYIKFLLQRALPELY